ncbi:MAG: YcxB family protein [Oscillospiraceae bacterium]|nr:YcxB family protein [Oscillospiraceae bacterium]
MEFTFDTVYDQKAVTAMARGLRMTIRKKRSRRSHIFGWFVIGLVLLLTLPLDGSPLVIEGRTVVTWAAGLLIFVTLLFEDRINAWLARRRMLAGTDRAVSTFTEDGYCTETAVGKTEWRYENIQHVAEDKDYFIFVFDKRYAQVYAKDGMTGGTVEEFRAFISKMTGKELQSMK